MIKMAMDTLDIQARDSTSDMIKIVKFHFAKNAREMRKVTEEVLDVLSKWDYHYDKDSIGASIMAAWDHSLVTHMHSKRIKGQRARRTIGFAIMTENFLYKEIQDWATSKSRVYEDYCEFESGRPDFADKSCQSFLAFTLEEAIRDLQFRMGRSPTRWRYDRLTKVTYAHAPFSGIPLLKKIYGKVDSIAGSKHTLRMSFFMHHNEKNGPYNAFAGSVMRMIVDVANDDYIQIAMDVGVS